MGVVNSAYLPCLPLCITYSVYCMVVAAQKMFRHSLWVRGFVSYNDVGSATRSGYGMYDKKSIRRVIRHKSSWCIRRIGVGSGR